MCSYAFMPLLFGPIAYFLLCIHAMLLVVYSSCSYGVICLILCLCLMPSIPRRIACSQLYHMLYSSCFRLCLVVWGTSFYSQWHHMLYSSYFRVYGVSCALFSMVSCSIRLVFVLCLLYSWWCGMLRFYASCFRPYGVSPSPPLLDIVPDNQYSVMVFSFILS